MQRYSNLIKSANLFPYFVVSVISWNVKNLELSWQLVSKYAQFCVSFIYGWLRRPNFKLFVKCWKSISCVIFGVFCKESSFFFPSKRYTFDHQFHNNSASTSYMVVLQIYWNAALISALWASNSSPFRVLKESFEGAKGVLSGVQRAPFAGSKVYVWQIKAFPTTRRGNAIGIS